MTSRRGVTFTVDERPCPQCGNFDVVGVLLVDGSGNHQHTRYLCTRWDAMADIPDPDHPATPCGWTGWSVPEPQE